ncbi:MAG: tannase/feruloyl esterase family alpha/beta hydrolase, partial [Caulobacterales bacterium]|nr:tannase/feruloyl esterase family alpha/beta hydrolase [Caulobacterales bacterium]
LRLPDAWNGRFFFQGGGGPNGAIGNAIRPLMGAQPSNAVSQGYAVVSQDSGHDNDVNRDPARQGEVTFGWDPQARADYGGASIPPVAATAKALIARYYGRGPQFSYYVGGSKGGQEGFMAVQRYATLFDGVLAGYPGFRLADAGGVGQMWDAQAMAEAARAMGAMAADGQPLLNKALTDDDLLLVSGAVLKACDGLDGLEDGIIEAFPACNTARVAPALTAITCAGAKAADCLAPAQVAALRKIFDGAKGPDGRLLYADWPWDAGIAYRNPQGAVSGGWRMWKLGPYASPTNTGLAVVLGGKSASAVFTSPPTEVADDPGALTRYSLGVNVVENARKGRVKWGALNQSSVDFMNADSGDLSEFNRRGGKLLIYHGVSDPVFSINDTIAWLEKVNVMDRGQASKFVRLFPVPGMNHGQGGPATDQFDAFGALVAWRERGVAPTQFTATARPGTPWPGRTRLLCAWPQQPRYQGGDKESAASFRCVNP